jgi:AraC family transcriptional regulator
MELKLKAGHFYGKTSQSLSARGFRFTEKAYSRQASLPAHAHELSHFCFVLAGNYHEHIGRRLFHREPLTLVYYPPDVSHAEEHFTNGRHLLVEIDSGRLDRIKEYGARLDEPVFVANDPSRWLATRMYREFSDRDGLSELALESLSNELLIAVSRQSTRVTERKPPMWLAWAQDVLRDNFVAPPSLDELARIVEVHPTHLARVFRQFERCTIGDYVRRLRVDYARRRIVDSPDPLVEIALSAGFADQTHFTRTFKRVTGMTPKEFRRTFTAR